MKKKILSLFIVFVLILFGISFIFWLKSTQEIRRKVLDDLQKELEFCKIVKDRILPPKGKFWMVCNGRPFYATYENGKINYELNGWGFLKEQPEILDELERNRCQFYDFSQNKLTFICEDRMVRFYEFSPLDFKLSKIDEDFDINFLSGLVRSKYDCAVIGEKISEMNEEKFLRLVCNCQGKETILNFNMGKRNFSLPIVIESGFTNEERANFSFQLVNVCKKDFVQEIGEKDVLLGLDCNIGKPLIKYDFEFSFAHFLINNSEFESLFPFLGRYHLLDFAGVPLKFIKEEERGNTILRYYFAQDKVIVAEEEKGSGLISEIYIKDEGIQ
jgi:hypothetical protein